MDGFAFEKKKVDSVRKSRGSSLSQGFAAFDINGDSQAHGRGHPGLVVPPLGNLPELNLGRRAAMNVVEGMRNADLSMRTAPMDIPGAAALDEHSCDSDGEPKSVGGKAEKKLRGGCDSPQLPMILKPGGNLPPFLKATRRRGTLADKPELDHKLKAACVEYNGQSYLPLTAPTFKKLSPLWQGAKPIADVTIFKNLLIDEEVNATHADHVVAALGRIGGHCQELVIKSSIKTSELGDVFAREQFNFGSGNDWAKVFRALPYLKNVAVVDNPSGASSLSNQQTVTSIKAALDLVYQGKKIPALTVV